MNDKKTSEDLARSFYYMRLRIHERKENGGLNSLKVDPFVLNLGEHREI